MKLRTPPTRPAAASPTGGAASGPAAPDPRLLLGEGRLLLCDGTNAGVLDY
jgi:hypothetical protein